MSDQNQDQDKKCERCRNTGILLIPDPQIPPSAAIQVCPCDAGVRVNNELLKQDRERVLEVAYRANPKEFIAGDQVPQQQPGVMPPKDAKTALVMKCRCRGCGNTFFKTVFFTQPVIESKVKSRVLVQAAADQGVSVHHCTGRYHGFTGIAEVLGGAFYPVIHTAGLIV